MAKHKGTNGVFKCVETTESPGTPAAVGEMISIAVDESANTIPANAMGDTASKHLDGLTSWTATAEMHWDPASGSNQQVLSIGSSVDIEYQEAGTTAGSTRGGTATVTSRNVISATEETVKATVGLEGNGALAQTWPS
jgi:hypothetical protein